MRIAHVIETLGVGGAEMHLLEVLRRLDPAHFQSRVFPLNVPLDLKDRLERCGIEVQPVLEDPRRSPVSCWRVLHGLLRRFDPTIVHTHLYYANIFGRLGAFSAGRLPVVTTLHNPDYSYEAKATLVFQAKKTLDRVTGRRNAVHVAVSEAVAADYRKHMGWEHVRVIRNGVDTATFAPGPSTHPLDFWQGGLKLISVGRLHPQKGHSTLLEALARCRQNGVSAFLAVVGEGALRPALEEQVRALGLGDCVQLLGRRDDVLDLLRSADVFVFPSNYEAVGVAMLEAMACGLPVVASDTGGIPEVLEDGISGLLVPPRDVPALAAALCSLAAATVRRRMGDASRARALQFRIETTVRGLEDLYAEIGGLDSRPRPHEADRQHGE